MWTQLWRFIESSLAQEFQAHVDFQRLCEKQLTNAYGGLLVIATGLIFRDMWRAKALGFMMVIRMEAAQNHVKEKNIE